MPRFLRSPRPRFGATFFALSLITLLTGCAPKEPATVRGVRDQVLLIGNGAEPEDLDPHTVTGLPEFRIMGALFEGLTAYHPKTLAIIPGAAAHWEITPDGLTYTFHLRPDARWSNGDPVTADDFTYAWRRVLSPALGNRYTYLYGSIRGATDFHADRISWSEVGIHSLDAHTLRIELDRPLPFLPGLLTHNTFFPVHRATIEAHGAMDERGTAWTQPGHLVGNGAFILQTWRHARFIEVRPNPHYWDRAKVRLNAVRFYPIESADTEERAFRTGQLHITNTVPSHVVPRLIEEGSSELRLAPFLAVYYYALNVTRPPLDDPRVRRALSLALDRDALVTSVTQAGEQPARSFLNPALLGDEPGPTLTEDVATARRLLAEAGFPNGRGFPRLELLFNTLETHRALAEAVQQMWRTHLGIDVQLINQEWQVYLSNMREGQFDIARAGWVAAYQDLTVFTDLLTSDSGNNHSGWTHAGFDKLAESVRHELDPARRIQVFHAAGDLLNKEMPVIPLFFYTSRYLRHPAVRGWHDNLLNIHPLKHVYLEPENSPPRLP